MNDRDWLTTQYLPKLNGRILYIGVNDYTSHYHNLVGEGSRYESLDCCPIRSAHGSTSAKHHTMFLKDFEDKDLFDHVSMHGCHGHVGHKIDNSSILSYVSKADSLVKVGGTFQFGPTCSKIMAFQESFWEDLIRDNPIFQKYETLYSEAVEWGHNSPDKNYIWWGRKLEE